MEEDVDCVKFKFFFSGGGERCFSKRKKREKTIFFIHPQKLYKIRIPSGGEEGCFSKRKKREKDDFLRKDDTKILIR